MKLDKEKKKIALRMQGKWNNKEERDNDPGYQKRKMIAKQMRENKRKAGGFESYRGSDSHDVSKF